MKKVLFRATTLARIVMTLLLMLSVVGYNNSVVYGEILNEVNLTIVPPTVGEKTDEATPDVTISDEIGVTVESKKFVDETGAEYQKSVTFEEAKELGIQVVLKANSDNSFDENTKVIPSVGNLLNDPALEDNTLTFTVITTPQKQENKEKSDKETDEIVPLDDDILPLGIPNDTSSNGQCPQGHDWDLDSITYDWTEKGEDLNEYYEVEASATCVNETEEAYEKVSTRPVNESYTKQPSTTEEGEITFVADFKNDPFTPQDKVLIAPAIPGNVNWNFDIGTNYGSWDQYYDDEYAFRNQIQIFEENDEETDWYEPSGDTGRDSSKDFSKLITKEGKYHFRARIFVYDPYEEYTDHYKFGKYSEWSDFVQFYKLTVNKIVLDEQGNVIDNNQGYIYFDDDESSTAICREENTEEKFLPVTRTYGLSASDGEGYAFVKYEVNGVEKTDNEIEFTPSSNLVINAYFQEDNSESTITVKFGEKHADVAKDFKDALPSKYSATVKDDVVTYKYPKVGSSEGYVLYKMPDQFYDIVDDEESLRTFAKKPIDKYQSDTELFNEQTKMYNTPLGDTLELNAIWFKKASKGTFIVEAPVCGQEVKVIEEFDPDCDPMEHFCYSTYSQENGPVVTAAEDSHFVVGESAGFVPTALWMSEKGMYLSNWLDNVTIDGDDSYLARISINLKFGYYASENLNDFEITVNGNPVPAEDFEFYGSPAIYSTIKATHKWEFTHILWDFDSTNKKTIASAFYKCGNDGERASVPMEIDESDPRKMVATVSAEDSLDGQEHSNEIFKVYDLYVQGVLVTGGNCDDILEDGTVKFDPETGLMTLDNATIDLRQREFGQDLNEYGIRSYVTNLLAIPGGAILDVPFTIEMNGATTFTNEETESDTEQLYGIYLADTKGRDFEITGDDSLNMEFNADKTTQGIHYNSGLCVLNIPEVNIDLTGTGDINGIHVVRLGVESGEVKVHVGDRYAVYTNSVDVKEGAILEMICDGSEGKAVTNTLTADTKELGALVNKDPSRDGSSQWDKTTDLTRYKYVRIPGSHKLTIVWTSIDGDEQMKSIEVMAEVGTTIQEAVENLTLFEKDGYVALDVFVPKPISEYENEYELVENNMVEEALEKDTVVFYPMIKLVDKVEINLDPPVSGDTTTTSKKVGEWDWINQTNKPRVSTDSEEYRVFDDLSFWIEELGTSPYTPFIGTFESGKTYNGSTIVIHNYGYRITEDTEYVVENAKVVNNNHGIVEFTVEVKDARYYNSQGAGGTWTKGSGDTLDFTFKR